MCARLGLLTRASHVSMKCLVDTGASVSLLRRDVFNEICDRSNRSKLLRPAPALCTISGGPIKVFGKTEIEFEELGSLPMLVVDGILHQCVFGDDVLFANRAILNYEKKELLWKGKVIKLCRYGNHRTVDSTDGVPGRVEGDHVFAFGGTTDPTFAQVIGENRDVFYEAGRPFGQCPLTEVTFNTGDHPPIRQRPYRTPLAKRKIVDECIDQMLRDGVIVPSNSPWASPIYLVPKKDGETRFWTCFVVMVRKCVIMFGLKKIFFLQANRHSLKLLSNQLKIMKYLTILLHFAKRVINTRLLHKNYKKALNLLNIPPGLQRVFQH